MLLEANLIDEVQMKVALAEQKRTGKKFGSTLVDLKFVDENVLAAFLSKQIDIPCISLLNVDIPRRVTRSISADVARECCVVPVRIDDDRLEVAMTDPTDMNVLQRVETASEMTVIPLIAPQSSIEKMIERLYPKELGDDTVAVLDDGSAGSADPMFRDLIEEIERGDFDGRFEEFEKRLGDIWTILEKMLRKLESIEREIESSRQVK